MVSNLLYGSDSNSLRAGTRRFQGSAIHLTILLVCSTAIFLSKSGAVFAAEDAPSDGATVADALRIEQLVHDLGDPSYARRNEAMRELCAIGAAAIPSLKTASTSNDPEVAMRSAKLLEAFEQVLFSGVQVSLEFSAAIIDWETPVELRATFVNKSKFPARLPFALPQDSRPERTADARQVADMLDLSEWLQVRTPGGRELELRVDDIAEDADVQAVVQARLGAGPSSTLAPGESTIIVARAFNRGWARYAMLDGGEYTVEFEYTPQWQDAQLLANHVGQVKSAPARLRINAAAPMTISREGADADLTLERAGEMLEARFVNHSDRPVHINLNFGPSTPFADGRWLVESDSMRREIPSISKLSPTWSDFEAAKLIEVRAGESVPIAKISVDDLRSAVQPAGDLNPLAQDAAHRNDASAAFTYSNLCDRQWQARQEPAIRSDPMYPKVLRDPLPLRLLSTRQTSNRISLAKGDASFSQPPNQTRDVRPASNDAPSNAR
ncbi:MAG: hypothetical protein HYR83_09895 [Planctomycetes bacterium]|nr:hypothetical protein [Planctomycetota bacterium]